MLHHSGEERQLTAVQLVRRPHLSHRLDPPLEYLTHVYLISQSILQFLALTSLHMFV